MMLVMYSDAWDGGAGS